MNVVPIRNKPEHVTHINPKPFKPFIFDFLFLLGPEFYLNLNLIAFRNGLQLTDFFSCSFTISMHLCRTMSPERV